MPAGRGATAITFGRRQPRFPPSPEAPRRRLYAAYSALGASGVSQGNTSGFIGGGQIGYNWQFWGGRLVAGVEADIQGVASGNSNKTSVTAAGAFPFLASPAKSLRPRSRPRSASTISARFAADSVGSSPRPCLSTAPAVSPTAASPCRPASRSSTMTALCSRRNCIAGAAFSSGSLFRHACRLDGGRRPGVDVHAELVRQGRISVLRSRQCQLLRRAS